MKTWVRSLRRTSRPEPPAATGLRTTWLLSKHGVVRPMRPDKLWRIFLAWRHWGTTLPFGFATGAIRHPDRPAVIDERGALSYAEVHQRTTRLALALRDRLRPRARIGVLCRNHHGLLETIVAATKIGVDVVLLNTGLSGPQLNDVCREQRIGLLVLDGEFTEHLPHLPEDLDVLLGWTEGTTEHETLEHLIHTTPTGWLPKPARHSRVIVLTSGTTGTPKGARRPDPPGLSPAAALLSRIPLKAGERVLICAPMFHTWGFAAFQLSTVLGATMVLQRKFAPERALRTTQRFRCTSLFAVPVMLQRILELPRETRQRYDHRSLRVVAVSGSALPADLATRFQRTFGNVLYNLYGSTEVSWVSIATPQDLLAAPDTAGRPPLGTVVRVLDKNGNPVPPGVTGRIFAKNEMLFEGYTNGSGREVLDGLMNTGDLGRFDTAGRLYVVGREDDMIISGGVNVYPQEAENVLIGHPAVDDVAVFGIPNPDLGEEVKAYVIRAPGAEATEEELVAWCREQMASYKYPRVVEFRDSLPMTATGKILKRELI